MTVDTKRRFDIYLNGRQGLKELTVDLLLSWRQVPRLARPVWRSIVDLFWDLLPLLIAMLGPGIWDDDNGALAGKPCAWCIAWNGAADALAAAPSPQQGKEGA